MSVEREHLILKTTFIRIKSEQASQFLTVKLHPFLVGLSNVCFTKVMEKLLNVQSMVLFVFNQQRTLKACLCMYQLSNGVHLLANLID